MPWKVRKSDVDFFINDLWKDARPFPVSKDPGKFAKDCFDLVSAHIEAAVLLHLRNRISEDAFPQPLTIADKRILIMERIPGIRLFDLLRHLRMIESEQGDGHAAQAMRVLLERCRERLRLIQLELFEVKNLYSLQFYPLEMKLKGLLELFIRVLDIRPPHDWLRCLEELVAYWESECSILPFRDATTKNMIVSDTRFSIDHDVDDIDSYQLGVAKELVNTADVDYWNNINIVDIDFSSVVHLTSIEDDPVSLNCHEWTYGSIELSPKSFVLSTSLGQADEYRLAATFVVRYLRFGGRKLAYKLINSQGFKVRFAFDDPLFYFAQLPEICSSLSAKFYKDYEPLILLIRQIAESGYNPSASDKALLSVDHIRQYYPEHTNLIYWQQNPLARGI